MGWKRVKGEVEGAMESYLSASKLGRGNGWGYRKWLMVEEKGE